MRVIGSRTRIGLIGSGNISATHVRAIADIADARVVAVYGRTIRRAQALAAESEAQAYDDLDAFFDGQPIDVVIIGTPSGLHGTHGAAAARRGIHLLVEKPLEITAARADALIAEADRGGVTLGVIFQDRVKPDVQNLKARLDAGTIGAPFLVRAQVPWWRPVAYYRDSQWRGTWALDGGGALMNQGIHTVDLVQWLCGPVARVCGKTATRCHDIEVEDTAVAVLEFASGALGTLEATTCAFPGRPRRIEISGSSGTLVLQGDSLERLRKEPAPAPENASSPAVADVSAHRDVLLDFMHATRSGSLPCCTGPDARRSVAVIEAIYESARRGVPVDVAARPEFSL